MSTDTNPALFVLLRLSQWNELLNLLATKQAKPELLQIMQSIHAQGATQVAYLQSKESEGPAPGQMISQANHIAQRDLVASQFTEADSGQDSTQSRRDKRPLLN